MLDDEFDVVVGPEGVSLGAAPIEELFKDELERWGLTPEEVRRGWKESAPYISRLPAFASGTIHETVSIGSISPGLWRSRKR